MRFLKTATVAAFTLISATVAPLAASAETLTDAMIAAYRNSNLLDQNQALLRAADEDAAIALARLRPVINFTVQSTYRWQETSNFLGQPITTDDLSTSAALTADMNILDFGRGALAVEVAKESVLATREGLVNIEQQVLGAAIQAFVQVRLAQEIVDLRQSNVRLITQELRAAQDRFEVGEITRTDVAIAESRLAASRANLAAAEGDLAVAREAYKAAVGRYPGNLAPLPGTPALPKSLQAARDVAVRTHPQIKQAQRQAAIADLNVARAQADTRPTLTGRASVGLAEGGNTSNTLSLTLNQTIYAGGQLAALYRRAIAQREAARSGLLQTSVQIEQQVGNAWANLEVTNASIQATDRQIAAAQTAYDGVREEAKVGSRTTLDVLNAEQELLDARAGRLQAVANRYLSVYGVLQSMGLLTVDHLKLGIPTYDPAAYYNTVKNAPVHSIPGAKLDRILKSIGN
ncbi:transporter [Aliigemmobacter aestuarii]|uniref:Transporter n=1 Tax=Aliigemmobacter aestuarii TaxID=1445661 RepID=A0A4S3MQ53_9RHOB|nr:TolC family outer membrane protein [Gemmobacter aestuarii]THD84507.1 transporter [Gemmobacter aestuarii]